jgi:hypothetical protein
MEMRPPVYRMSDFYAYHKTSPIFCGAIGWSHIRNFSTIMMHNVSVYATFYKDLCFE